MFKVTYNSCQWFDDSDEVKITKHEKDYETEEEAIEAYVSACEDYENSCVKVTEVA
jgi:hypothetical protein